MQVGGLLCQSSYREQRFRVVLGVGLNVSNRAPTTCVDAAIEQQHRRLGLPGSPLPVSMEVHLNPKTLRVKALKDAVVQQLGMVSAPRCPLPLRLPRTLDVVT